MKTATAGLMLASLAMAELKPVTITTAPAAVQTALISYISDYDHHTLGVNMTVGAAISSVYMVSAAYPTAADAILNVRSHINFMEGPTPLFKDLENPTSVISSIAAQLPTVAPFPDALAVISDLYAYLGDVASSELNHLTTIAPAPSGWTLSMEQPEATATSSSPSSAVVASECPASTTTSAAANAAATTPKQEVVNKAGTRDIPTKVALVALTGTLCLAAMAL